MDWERKKKIMVRYSLLTAGAIALFWAGWYLVNGSVPAVTAIEMTSTWSIQLPFSVSRWWDVLIGPIWSVLLILVFTNDKIQKDEELADGLVFGLALGLVFGLALGLVIGLTSGLASGLASVLVFELVFGPVYLLVKKFCQPIADWLTAR